MKKSKNKKLYDVPRNSYIKFANSENNEVYHFHHVDGMYSFCLNKNGEVVHIQAFADVEVVSKEEFDTQLK